MTTAQADVQAHEQTATTEPVKLVDCDVHAQATEPMLAAYLGPPAGSSSATAGARRGSPSGTRAHATPACASTRGPTSPATSGAATRR